MATTKHTITQPDTTPEQQKHENFVRVWQRAKSPQEVATTLGVKIDYVKRQAGALRKNDVPLKKMSRGRAKINYASLRALAENLAATQQN